MLKLTLLPEEYLTIDDKIVVQLIRVAGGRADVAIEAPRELPVVRGTVLERTGGRRPRRRSRSVQATMAAPAKISLA